MCRSKTKAVCSKQGSDDYNTPKLAWEHIMEFVPPSTAVHMPFYNDGKAKEYLTELGVDFRHEKKDFFDYQLKNKNGSPMLIIDNPPFTIKEKIIDTLYNRKGQSFVLLLPIDTLSRVYMKKYTKNFQLVIPHESYGFYNSNGYKASPQKCVWFCWRMAPYLKTSKAIIRLDKTIVDKYYDALEEQPKERREYERFYDAKESL